MTALSGDGVVPNDDLTADDRAALRWAASSGHELGTAVVARVRSGRSGLTFTELTAIRGDWERLGRPAPERHVHRTPVVLADGVTVVGVTFVQEDAYTREVAPTFGLYLDERWNPPWPHGHVEWPDFGLPADLQAFRAALVDVHERARRGERVELGCLGGHGRTGTALACLAVLAGTPARQAVSYVRANYCPKAIETTAQEQLVSTFRPEATG